LQSLEVLANGEVIGRLLNCQLQTGAVSGDALSVDTTLKFLEHDGFSFEKGDDIDKIGCKRNAPEIVLRPNSQNSHIEYKKIASLNIITLQSSTNWSIAYSLQVPKEHAAKAISINISLILTENGLSI
jgi:hypothetical protein